ncbi:hypothetical protein HMN09_00728900 [Mycena chlorophos]|uniref:Uncharacterized protein n=1 Tax=Mycena chlorophos TaxID=658473 RepID=A0A8H6SUZ1_MYCCL|nr:hypothetical protein HMN09_00728900 [Mycena chlorophos]
MKLALAIASISIANLAVALPTKRGDVYSLNLALQLEHLQNAFFKQALDQFTESAFVDAGEPQWLHGRLEQMSDHDASHQTFLSTALKTAGAPAMASCEFAFSFTDPRSVVDQAVVLKQFSVAATNGLVRVLDNRDYAAVVSSMMGTEARHSAWLSSAVQQRSPWSTAFETALGPRQSYSMLLSYAKSCPTDNKSLKPFPTLALNAVQAGQPASVAFTAPDAPDRQLFAAFINGAAAPVFVPLEESNTKVKVPENLFGFVYVVITSDGGRWDDDVTVAGPILLERSFNAEGQTV